MVKKVLLLNSEKLRAFGDKLHNSFLLRSESLKKAQLFGQPSSLLPQKRIRVLKILALISYIVMLAMQFYCVLSFKGVPIGDAWRYTRDAMECHNAGVWYPMTEDFDVRGGLAGTGLVNWMVLLFRITTNMKIVYFFNILFVQVILFCTLYLAKKITHSDTILYPTAILFCMFGTFWSEVCIARTEILFTALAFASLALAIKRSRLSVIASGFLLCLANWVRPLGISFFIAILWLFLVLRSRPMVYVRFVAAFCAGVLLCSFWNYYNGGVFSYQPSVASGNLLMGCNEDADGSYSKTVFYPGHVGYIPDEEINSMTFKEINKVVKKVTEAYCQDQVETAAAVKSYIAENLQPDGELDPQEVGKAVFKDSPSMQADYKQEMENAGFTEPVHVDQQTTLKKMRKHKLSTDTGIELTIPTEFFENTDYLEFYKEEDGSMSITLKNIQNIMNKS